jgi:uncharacterized protein YcbX
MTIRVEAMFVAPVKSLALAAITSAHLGKPGIAGDRAFFVVDEQDRLVTQREHDALVKIAPEYDVASGHIRLAFPGGQAVAGVAEPGEPVRALFFGERHIDGHIVSGEFSQALSDFADRPLRLVKAATAGTAFDAFPLSIASAASLDAVARAAGVDAVDQRRFRENIYLSGIDAHGEDEWLGSEIQVGAAVLRVKMRDPRCVMTTHNPDTGETDMNTLKIIASYRTDQPKEVNFGVYCTVAQPGAVALGDEVIPWRD